VLLEYHANDNAREGRPSVWIFEGKSVVFLVCGVAAFIAVFRILAACGLDWPINIGISLLPLIGVTAYVHFCVNGKPPSYFVDMVLLFIWRGKARLYLSGALDRPPVLWAEPEKPKHPHEF
jgi:hypothetical protein